MAIHKRWKWVIRMVRSAVWIWIEWRRITLMGTPSRLASVLSLKERLIEVLGMCVPRTRFWILQDSMLRAGGGVRAGVYCVFYRCTWLVPQSFDPLQKTVHCLQGAGCVHVCMYVFYGCTWLVTTKFWSTAKDSLMLAGNGVRARVYVCIL